MNDLEGTLWMPSVGASATHAVEPETYPERDAGVEVCQGSCEVQGPSLSPPSFGAGGAASGTGGTY
jgi:hypothetical protein